jgi:hypothetical protein
MQMPSKIKTPEKYITEPRLSKLVPTSLAGLVANPGQYSRELFQKCVLDSNSPTQDINLSLWIPKIGGH